MKSQVLLSMAGAAVMLAHPVTTVADKDVETVTPVENAGLPAILGHNGLTYRLDFDWAKVTPEQAPVINSHAMVEGKDGLLYLVTDHPKEAFLVFKKDGTFVRSFGENLNGGHGVDLIEIDGVEHLIHVDCGWHFKAEGWDASKVGGKISILSLEGELVREFKTPQELGKGVEGELFLPCDVAIAPNGNILVADGYSTDMIFEYTPEGEIVNSWGGRKEGDPGTLVNAHGISIDLTDPEKPLVWISSRDQNEIKAFTPDGEFVETIKLPGAYAGQLFIRDGKMYSAVCWSRKDGTGDRQWRSGFLVVLDAKTRKVISAPGGTEPIYKDGELQPIHQKEKAFMHGHDLYVDSEGAIYLGEWNAERRYPTKLTPAL